MLTFITLPLEPLLRKSREIYNLQSLSYPLISKMHLTIFRKKSGHVVFKKSLLKSVQLLTHDNGQNQLQSVT